MINHDKLYNKIECLLQSFILEDVILAIQLSYKLPLEDFRRLYGNCFDYRRLNLRQTYGTLNYEFSRGGIDYSFGSLYIGTKPKSVYTPKYINITPYEGEDT